MKKYILLIFSLLLSVSGFAKDPSGLLKDYVVNPERPGYGLTKILSGQPIKYMVTEGKKAKPKKGKAPDYASDALLTRGISSRAAVVEGFNRWFIFTKEAIIKSGRQEEFADILPLLSRPVTLQEVTNEEDADMSFEFVSYEEMQDICGGTAGGCQWGVKIILPYIEYTQAEGEDWDSIDVTLVHEIGHFYGLADEYRSAYNKSPEYSTSGRTNKHLSIMDIHEGMGCDDVDGFINAIDFSLAYKKGGKWSDRAIRGWQSFCDNTMFAEGKQLDKPDYIDKQCVFKFGHKGDVSQKICPEPFVFRNRVIRYDEEHFPLTMEDQDLNITVSYHAWFGIPKVKDAVAANVKELNTQKQLLTLEAVRSDYDGFVSWDFPYEEDTIGVWWSNSQCHLGRLRDLGVLESEDAILDATGKLVGMSYNLHLWPDRNYLGKNQSLFSEKHIDAEITAGEDPKTSWHCNITLENTENALVYNEAGLIAAKGADLQRVADKYRVSVAALKDAGAKSCSRQRFVSSINLKDFKDLCRLTRWLENKFQQQKNQQ